MIFWKFKLNLLFFSEALFTVVLSGIKFQALPTAEHVDDRSSSPSQTSLLSPQSKFMTLPIFKYFTLSLKIVDQHPKVILKNLQKQM